MATIWLLPGPARFAAAIRSRLDRGGSVVVGLPGPLLGDDAFVQGLLRAIDYATDVVCDRQGPPRPLASLVAEQLGIDDIKPGPDATAALARHGTMAGRVLAVIAPEPKQCERWADFAQAFVAVAKTVPALERPRLILLGGAAVANAASRDPLLTDVWWWGVLDRLDTAFHVKTQLADAGDDLRRDSIAEVAGFDLRLADHLSSNWDGSLADLGNWLEQFTGPGPNAAPELFGAGAPALVVPNSKQLGVPPAALLPMWELGQVDRWDSFPAYWHACTLPNPAQLSSRLWRAQVRALMPTIDEERARIEVWLRRQLGNVPSETALEPRDLYLLLQKHPHLKTWRGGHRKRLVYWLRDARNTLAHMGLLTPGEVAYGQRLIVADRRCD